MNNNTSKHGTRTESIKNASTRQRWDLFHRAIAHAKERNDNAVAASAGGSPAELTAVADD